MVDIGFLGAGAPLYMDLFLLFTTLFPLLIALSVWQVRRENYRFHRLVQGALFGGALLLIVMVGYYGSSPQGVMIEADRALVVAYMTLLYLVSYGFMLLFWFAALKYAHGDHKRRALPGLYSKGHKRFGRWLLGWMVANTLFFWILYGVIYVA